MLEKRIKLGVDKKPSFSQENHSIDSRLMDWGRHTESATFTHHIIYYYSYWDSSQVHTRPGPTAGLQLQHYRLLNTYYVPGFMPDTLYVFSVALTSTLQGHVLFDNLYIKNTAIQEH